jgi:deoxyinosine 3'endonuclease (endonuclease V)
LGVLLDVPTVGAGKTLFFIDGLTKDRVKEQCDKEITKGGDFSLLKGDSGKVWGAALRNTEGAKNPIFVSIGTKIELVLAIEIIKKLSLYRVVEPIRLADKKSREIIDKINQLCETRISKKTRTDKIADIRKHIELHSEVFINLKEPI